MKTKVIIIEDDREFAEIQKKIINDKDNFECNHFFTNPLEYLNSKETYGEEIILLDIVMPQMNGLDAIAPILKKNPEVSIIINSIQDDVDVILRAIQEGAVGYLDKQNFYSYFDVVLESVVNEGAYMTPKVARKVFNYFHHKKQNINILTVREKQVANGIIDGMSYKMIADHLNISLDTVRMNVRNIYKKFKIQSRTELINIIGTNK